MGDIYSIIVKKNGVSISLSSQNKTLILVEYRKWLINLSAKNKEKIFEITEQTTEKLNNKKNKIKEVLIKNKTQHVNKTTSEQISDEKSKKAIKISNIKKAVLKNKEIQKTKKEIDFGKVLEKKMEDNNAPKVVEKQISELQNVYLQMKKLINAKNLTTQQDYILAAAYCLNEFEGKNQFDITQLNIKTMPFLFDEIDKKELDEVIKKGYLKIIPDFTGTSDNTEYALSELGENYFLNER